MLKKIPVSQLRVGMYLHDLDGPWIDHPFWRNRFVLSSPADLRKLAESAVKEVWIDPGLGLDMAVSAEASGTLPASPRTAAIDKNLAPALAAA